MNHLIPYLFNFVTSSILIFLLFALLAEGIIALFRIKNYRLIYWLRLLPFIKLPLSFLNYSGSQWLLSAGQTVLEQPAGTRFLGVAVGAKYFPFFNLTATTQNGLNFGIGDMLRDVLPLRLPLLFILSLATVSLTLILYHLYHSFVSQSILKKMLASATLLQRDPIPLYESTASTHSPLLIGIRGPRILLPRGLKDKLTPEELNAILKHESAHLFWKDHLISPLIHTLCLTFWFIPFLRWYFRRVALTREMACDQSAHPLPDALVSALGKTTRHVMENHLMGAIGFKSQVDDLKIRVRSVMETSRKPLSKWKKITVALVMSFLVIFLLNSSVFPF